MAVADIAGQSVYYEVTGEGAPVVLLHGGFGSAEAWLAQTPALVEAGFQVWVPERSGHGRSPDVPGPFSYDTMAEQTAAFLDAVVDARAHLVGWSDGAVVGALVARHRPELVDRLVLIGQYFDSSGEIEGGLASHLADFREAPPAFLSEGYARISPDGADHFPVVFNKSIEMVLTWTGLPLAELAKIGAPTLVLQGDRDEVRLEHSAAVATAIPDARLAVLPGTHALPLESPHVVNPLLIDFLRGGPAGFDWMS
ncbi:MAG TPA: alpha/beta hydrolase [Pseudonocardiaceae bacterium]|nr:alpha/beta hydrolase [Pseudonocardiaceae bacterium]